jgi:hypothetical protein
MTTDSEYTLNPGEYHPSANLAMNYLKSRMLDPYKWNLLVEAIANSSLASNRIAQLCYGTIKRLEEKQPISDRYLLGLVIFLKQLDDDREDMYKEVMNGNRDSQL